MKGTRMLIASAIFVIAGACAANPDPSADVGPTQETKVQVTNNNWSDMTIYAYRGGSRVRLGRVTSFGSEVFTLPKTVLASGSGFQLFAQPFASKGGFSTDVMSVFPGQTIRLKLENNLGVSTYSVW